MLGGNFGGPNVGGPTGGPSPQGLRPDVGGPPLGPFSPPAARPGMPPTVSAFLPEGPSRFMPGSVVRGEVAGKEGNTYTLRLNDQTMTAKSNVPLQVGQTVQFQIQGEDQGQLLMQLVKTPFTKLSTADLASNLESLKMPPSPANLELAQTMVEHGIPLTKENFQMMQQATSLPNEGHQQMPPLPERVAATTFLTQNNIPVTPQNVATLSNFLASNPQVGQQMFQLNGELRKLARSSDSAALEMLREIPEAVGEMMMGPGPGPAGGAKAKPPTPPGKKLFNMAKQTGIETNLTPYGGGRDDPWELLAELRQFRQECEGQAGLDDLMKLIKGLEGNIEAQKLINMAHPENWMGFYYLQVPMVLGDADSAEIWVKYYNEDDGSRYVDPDDTRIDFLVTTEHMGELTFILELKNGVCHVELGTPSEEVRQFAARYLPVLGERLAQLEWLPGRMEAVYRPHGGKRKLVERTDFDQLETCDVQA